MIEKWVVHIMGPDDVIEQPDELTALRAANGINLAALSLERTENTPFVRAVALVERIDGRFPEPLPYHIKETDVDVEAVAWAYQKLSTLGLADNSPENAMMMDRLQAMLGV